MRRDWKLTVAILVLIGLVAWLLVISLNRDKEIERAIQEIRQNQPSASLPQVINGKTPLLGVDYFNGQDGQNGRNGVGMDGKDGKNGLSAYDIAVKNGFTGTEQQWLDSLKVKGDKGDKGDRGDDIQLVCIEGYLRKKLATDDLWSILDIKCEVAHE